MPLSPIAADLLFQAFSQPCTRGLIIVTADLRFDESTSAFSNERLNGALRVHAMGR